MDGIDDRAISYLYQHAKLLAFYSYTEDFGLPLIESIMRGTPVIAADIPVSREVAGDFCVWFEQDNAEELYENVLYMHNNAGIYKEQKKIFFNFLSTSWEKCGEDMKNIVVQKCV